MNYPLAYLWYEDLDANIGRNTRGMHRPHHHQIHIHAGFRIGSFVPVIQRGNELIDVARAHHALQLDAHDLHRGQRQREQEQEKNQHNRFRQTVSQTVRQTVQHPPRDQGV